MSVRRMFTISCDSCDMDDSDYWLGDMKTRLRDEGWKLGKKDICPDCQDNNNNNRERITTMNTQTEQTLDEKYGDILIQAYERGVAQGTHDKMLGYHNPTPLSGEYAGESANEILGDLIRQATMISAEMKGLGEEGMDDLEVIEVNIFRGHSPEENRVRVFGGQVAGQSLVAASRTVDEAARYVHSLHAYFLRPGDPYEAYQDVCDNYETGYFDGNYE